MRCQVLNGYNVKKWLQILFKKTDYKSAREYYNELNIYAPQNFIC